MQNKSPEKYCPVYPNVRMLCNAAVFAGLALTVWCAARCLAQCRQQRRARIRAARDEFGDDI